MHGLPSLMVSFKMLTVSLEFDVFRSTHLKLPVSVTQSQPLSMREGK